MNSSTDHSSYSNGNMTEEICLRSSVPPALNNSKRHDTQMNGQNSKLTHSTKPNTERYYFPYKHCCRHSPPQFHARHVSPYALNTKMPAVLASDDETRNHTSYRGSCQDEEEVANRRNVLKIEVNLK